MKLQLSLLQEHSIDTITWLPPYLLSYSLRSGFCHLYVNICRFGETSDAKDTLCCLCAARICLSPLCISKRCFNTKPSAAVMVIACMGIGIIRNTLSVITALYENVLSAILWKMPWHQHGKTTNAWSSCSKQAAFQRLFYFAWWRGSTLLLQDHTIPFWAVCFYNMVEDITLYIYFCMYVCRIDARSRRLDE